MHEATDRPPTSPGSIQSLPEAARDVEHLKLLSIFYYVMAGLQVLGTCGGTIYTGIGCALLVGGLAEPDVKFMGVMMLGVGVFVVIITAVFAVLYFLAARALRAHRRRIFCTVVAAITCLSVPLGTVLGIFTLIVLARPTVRIMFDLPGQPDPT